MLKLVDLFLELGDFYIGACFDLLDLLVLIAFDGCKSCSVLSAKLCLLLLESGDLLEGLSSLLLFFSGICLDPSDLGVINGLLLRNFLLLLGDLFGSFSISILGSLDDFFGCFLILSFVHRVLNL